MGEKRSFFAKLRNHKWAIFFCALAVASILAKVFTLPRRCLEHGSFKREKADILQRRNFLLYKLLTTPQEVLALMPRSVGTQFQGEWALYSCSMFAASLVNITKLYPETRAENVESIEQLIDIVISPELRHYDAMRWYEDPLESLYGDDSHVSYLSHLAWMICGYKEIGGSDQYDSLLNSVCNAMCRRMEQSGCLNLPTYPGEPIYIPDMLVAIVALQKYSDLHNGEYASIVEQWLQRAKTDWIDRKTGLLVSFLNYDGSQLLQMPVKGSYSALNCYYLTFVDEEFAKEQYERVKAQFWKGGAIAGLKEYADKTPLYAMDIDAGPILFGLSPSGTAFFTGSATYFEDTKVRNKILRTAELAGSTIRISDKRHYLLADIALVGEAIMLAMRTNSKIE
jgi:hypothetical protein